jgi:hypothetical protein
VYTTLLSPVTVFHPYALQILSNHLRARLIIFTFALANVAITLYVGDINVSTKVLSILSLSCTPVHSPRLNHNADILHVS